MVEFEDEYEEDFWCSVYLQAMRVSPESSASATADFAVEALRARATKLDEDEGQAGPRRGHGHGPS